jgi:DNA polymerase
MIVTIDFETYYSAEYSLRKMSEADYILSPLFQTLMVAIKVDRGPVMVHYGEAAVRDALAVIPWSQVAMASHNTRFDGSILAWRYGYTPKLYLDTFSMARALTHAWAKSSSLASVAKYLGLAPKGDDVVAAMGLRYEAFPPEQLARYGEYCAHDTELCYEIFTRFMAVGFPRDELQLIDLMLRMYIAPQVKLDATKLAEQLHHVRAIKVQALAQFAHIDKSVFSSQQQFAALLAENGVEVPMKTSPTTSKEIPALARGDRGFKELCEDDTQTPLVQALLATRMGVKSTIDETRTQTMLNLSQREWNPGDTGWMPVPYRYYGAHTGRPSGDGGFNFANLRRLSPIRDAITAPDGYRVVHRDSSQIECRMLAWLAGCGKLLVAFAQGRDVYSEFASRFYGRRITKANTLERFVGKTSVLGLGYGCGATKFRHVLFIGNGGISVDLSEADAGTLVGLYRSEYREVRYLWWRAESTLARMMQRTRPYLPKSGYIDRIDADQPIPVIREGSDAIWLPNGLAIQYPRLRHEFIIGGAAGATEIVYDGPYGAPKKLYGAKLVENICQALARIVITDAMRRVWDQTKRHPFMTTYDSLDYCVPASEAEQFDELLAREFSVPPTWARDLPLASEGGWGRTLLDAERGAN